MQGAAAPAVSHSGHEHVEELLPADVERATRRHQPPAWRHQAERASIDLVVSPERCGDMALALGERRRVDDDDVELTPGLTPHRQQIERIPRDPLDPIDSVQCGILRAAGECPPRSHLSAVTALLARPARCSAKEP